MKLEATTLPTQNIGHASGGKNRNSETTNQEFSDALRSQSGGKDKAATGRANDTDSKVNGEAKTKNAAEKPIISVDQDEVAITQDGVSGPGSDEIPSGNQQRQFDENAPIQHPLFLANQALMEQLTASNINQPGNLQGKVAIDVMRHDTDASVNPTLDQASAFDRNLKSGHQPEVQQKDAIGRQVAENLLMQKAFNSQSTDIDADLKNLQTSLVSRQAAMAPDQQRTDNKKILPELAAKQISANFNSPTEKPAVNGNSHILSAMAKEHAPVQGARQRAIGDFKPVEVKTVELKSADVKISDIKIGDVKLERVAPANFNQVIINALSSTGSSSPISTNVILPVQISNPLQKTLTIQLHPQNLGVVEVKISQANGNLSISVETNTLVAEKILKAEISVLTDKLAAMGIMHEEMTVRNNPGLEVVKDNNYQERNAGTNSSQMGDGHPASDEEHNFQQKLQESNASDGKMREADQIYSTPHDAGNKRDGIYL